MDNNTNPNTTTNTTTVKLDKGTKLILAMIALGLFLNAVPNLTQSAYAQLYSGATIAVEITDMPSLGVYCTGCN